VLVTVVGVPEGHQQWVCSVALETLGWDMSRTTSGHLLIADISGYTNYLTSSELEHAQEVLRSLMELLIDRTLPPLRVAGLRGDAVFSYGIAGSAGGGQALVETIEDTYTAFRRAIEQMVINTTCACNACANISTLDLKFLVHYGRFSITPLRGTDELVGSAVNELFRLLKNRIADSTGIGAYTAYTVEAVEALGLDGFTENLTRHTERYPDVGILTVWVQDMHPVWERDRSGTRFRIPPDNVLARVEAELPVPLGVAWELLLQPRYRSIVFGLDRQEPSQRQRGRIAEGSVFTCYHGRSGATTQTVLALEPLDFMVTEDTTPIPGARIFDEIGLESRGQSTAVTITVSRARGPWLSRFVNDLVGRRLLRPRLGRGLAALREVIDRELCDGTLVIPEPNASIASEVEATVVRSLASDDEE
jgi:hypothetical protein